MPDDRIDSRALKAAVADALSRAGFPRAKRAYLSRPALPGFEVLALYDGSVLVMHENEPCTAGYPMSVVEGRLGAYLDALAAAGFRPSRGGVHGRNTIRVLPGEADHAR